MLDQDVAPDHAALRNEFAAPDRVAGSDLYERLMPPSQRLIKVAEALHAASKRLGMFGN